MYNPPAFKQDDPAVLHALIREHPLALLVSHGPEGLEASHIPFLLYPDEGPHGTLRAHLARANGHAARLADSPSCLVVFQGEQGYVSPAWYPSKAETGRVVPTWNYVTIHIHGAPRISHDPAWLHRLLRDQSDAQEGQRLAPWSIDDAPANYIAAQMKAIVGLEIAIARIEGKWKLSQNKSGSDREGVIAGLQNRAEVHANPELARRMGGRKAPE